MAKATDYYAQVVESWPKAENVSASFQPGYRVNIPSGRAHAAGRIAEAGSEQSVEMRNIRKADLERDVGNSLRAGVRLG